MRPPMHSASASLLMCDQKYWLASVASSDPFQADSPLKRMRAVSREQIIAASTAKASDLNTGLKGPEILTPAEPSEGIILLRALQSRSQPSPSETPYPLHLHRRYTSWPVHE